jgi:hypothetical protein
MWLWLDYRRVLRRQLEQYDAGVRWPPACKDMILGAEERPLLGDVTKQSSEDRHWEYYSVCDSDIQILVTSCVLKCQISPITDPDPVYSHTYRVIICTYIHKSRDRSVGIATGYKLDDRRSIPGRARFSSLHNVETVAGVHPAFYLISTGVKAAGSWRWPLTSL